MNPFQDTFVADSFGWHYSDEGLQSGLIFSLLESNRAESMGWFRMPEIAETEYREEIFFNLWVTAWLPLGAVDQLHFHARVAAHQGFLLGWLKKTPFRRLISSSLSQDKAILEKVHSNIERFDHSGIPIMLPDSELGLLGPSVRCLFIGKELGWGKNGRLR